MEMINLHPLAPFYPSGSGPLRFNQAQSVSIQPYDTITALPVVIPSHRHLEPLDGEKNLLCTTPAI